MERLRWLGKPVISVSITTVVLAAILYLADPALAVQSIGSADPYLLLGALVLANIPVLVNTFVWRIVLRTAGMPLSMVETLRVVLSNIFVNNITPFGNIGGEAAVTYILSRMTDQPSGKIFSAVFASSLITLAPILTMGFVGLYLTGQTGLLLLILHLAGAVVLMRKRILLALKSRGGFLPDRIIGFIDDFRDSSKILLEEKGKLLPLFVLTHLSVLLDLASIIAIGASLGADLLVYEMFLVVPLARVANYAPTPGGSGPYELALSGLLVYFTGVELGTAVLVAVIYRAVTYYFGLLIGYIGFSSLQVRDIRLEDL